MSSVDTIRERISHELMKAHAAFDGGNAGRGRVCSRRAAGVALAWYLESHPRDGWGADMVSQLLHLGDDESFPRNVRDAAARLAARVSPDFTYAHPGSPLEDAQLVASHILSIMADAPPR